MATITYQFIPNQDVYLIDSCNDKPFVTQGRIIRVRSEVNIVDSTLVYDVQLSSTNIVKEFVETDIFVDKATALVDYDLRV